MLNCAEQVQIQKYKTHAYKTLRTAGIKIIMLKHPNKHKQEIKRFDKNVGNSCNITKIVKQIYLFSIVMNVSGSPMMGYRKNPAVLPKYL